MKILKKVVISIIIVMIIMSSIVPSSYGALTPSQQSQLLGFLHGYNDEYGSNGSKFKSAYSQDWRTNIFVFDYKKNVNPTGRNRIYSDCSSFVSFVYWTVSNYKMKSLYSGGWPWNTLSFKEDALYNNKYFEEVTDGTLQPGDVLYKEHSATWRHVMIYIGGNEYIHNGSVGVEIKKLGTTTYDRVFRIKDGIINGNLNTTLGNAVYTPGNIPDGDGDGGSGNGTGSDENEEYIEPQTGEDLGLKHDDFQYYGLPVVEEIKVNKSWITFKLSDIVDYIVGMAILYPKIALIGYTEIVEMLISSSLDAVVGVDISEYTTNILTFIMNSSRNVTIENIVYNRIPILDVDVFNFEALTQYTGTGADVDGGEIRDKNSYKIIVTIKEKIAVWYYIFRNMVIIAMLLVLIYIGIRMAITTIAEEKAKYKSLLTAWIVSFIIVIGIHYFMILIMQLNNEVIQLIIPDSIEGQEISLYETVRSRAYELKASRAIVGTILYMLLVWYTLKFLYIYAKRFLSIMILILMAPFASASFAITKIKDGKTPIFDNWIKEYTFNIIIQGIHAILYTFFVTIALKLGQESIAGVILAFILIKFMTKSDSIVRKIFRLRSGSKYSSLDNNLSAGEEFSKFVSGGGIVGLFAGSKIAKAYSNRWLKPVYSKMFGFAKGALNIPFQGLKSGVVTAARNHMDGKNYNANSKLNPFINAIASTSLINERQIILDKYGEPKIGADGKPLYIENINWQKRGYFIFGRDGKLVYKEITTSTRPVISDIDMVIAAERARNRNENKKAVMNFLKAGGNMIKGGALVLIGIPLMIDSPMLGLNIFLKAYQGLSPFYSNRRRAKIKGFRKPIKNKKFKFKDFGTSLKLNIKHAVNNINHDMNNHSIQTILKVTAFATGTTIFTKPIENSRDMILEMAQNSQKRADGLEVLYEIREAEADAVEDADKLEKIIKSTRSASSKASDDVINNINKEFDKALEQDAEIYSEENYKRLDKIIDNSVRDFRTKNQLRKFVINYGNQKNVNTKINKFDLNNLEKKIQDAIRKTDPNFTGQMKPRIVDLNSTTKSDIRRMAIKIKKASGLNRNSDFERIFKEKLDNMKAEGKTKLDELEIINTTNDIIQTENIRKSLRKINPKISTRTDADEFEIDIDNSNSIKVLKEEIRNVYGDKLQFEFEDRLDSLLEEKKQNGTTILKEDELKDFINKEIQIENISKRALFTSKDIDGMKDEIDQFMIDNGVNITFDYNLESKIKEKIENKSNTRTIKTDSQNTDEKAITGQELQDILYSVIYEKEKTEETPILTKEEVTNLVDMISEKSKSTGMKFDKKFEENVQKLMEEEIVKNTIEEHVKENYGEIITGVSVGELEKTINDKLTSNGYDVSTKDILERKDITSSLKNTVKENLYAESDEKDLKIPKTDVGELADLIKDASRLEKSVKDTLPYMKHSKDLANDINKLRALNHKAKKLGVKRKEKNGKEIDETKYTKEELKKEQTITDINSLVSEIWNQSKAK